MVNLRMRGNIDYVIAALWALIAVYVKQSGNDLPGTQTAAWVALGIGVVLALQTVMVRRRYPGGCCRIRGGQPANPLRPRVEALIRVRKRARSRPFGIDR